MKQSVGVLWTRTWLLYDQIGVLGVVLHLLHRHCLRSGDERKKAMASDPWSHRASAMGCCFFLSQAALALG